MNDNISEAAVIDQVAMQCEAVAHMAEALMKLHRVKAELLRDCPAVAPVSVIGPDTAFLMEMLGEALNNMDAVDEAEDGWMGPVFDRAHRMFPVYVPRADPSVLEGMA